MSTQLSTENRKQPPSIYTIMLFLAMIFMLIAVIAMFIELMRWYPELYNTQTANPSAMIAPLTRMLF